MKKIVLLLLLIKVIPATLLAQTFTHTEILGRPTDTSITIQVFFYSPEEVSIEYGTVSGVYPYQTAWQLFPQGEPSEIVLGGLLPNTRYYYRLLHRLPGTSNFSVRPEFTFHTQRHLNETFSFVVQADPHLDEQSDTALYRLCLNNQLQDEPDFMVDLGDFLMTDKLKDSTNVIPFDTITYRCHLLRSYYETECHSVPLFIALGNHEGEAGWNLNGTPNNIAVKGTQERQKYFLNPFPNNFYSGDTTQHPFVGNRENYYAWNWGNSLFIVLDPYWYTSPKPDSLHGWRWTLGETQYTWLKNTLENSNATFKFVFSHQLIGGDPDGRGGVEFADFYEWGGNNLDGTPGFSANRPGWYKPIKDLLTENHVNIFFHGHDHFFGKQEKECMIYQETPQPSHPNFMNASQAADYGYFQGQILPNSGHIRVTVSPAGVQVDYVRAYLPQNENANRHNKDVAATYFISPVNCYDSILTSTPVIWNSSYAYELIYPNPFSTETKIEFSLINDEQIELMIFNENAQLVRNLIPKNKLHAGKFQVNWDGRDNNGNQLANGIYYYHLNYQSGKSTTNKLILLN